MLLPEPALFWIWYFRAIVFAFGACIGSFLNVCIYRIPLEQSVVAPRSHCPTCKNLIAWYDNIPLWSWTWLRAKCRHCGTTISSRYVLVELLVAVLFAAVWWVYPFQWQAGVYMLVITGLVLGTFIDFAEMWIPDRVTIGGMILGPLLSMAVPALHQQSIWYMGLLDSAIGLAVGFGSLWGVAAIGRLIFRKEAMGFGDVKLLGAIGAFLGWKAVLFTIMISSLAGSIVGVVLIIAHNKEWQSRIPFGPYIALAAVIWILGGYTWMDRYVMWLTGVPQ